MSSAAGVNVLVAILGVS